MLTVLEKRTGIRPEPGWKNKFTRREAPGAMPNGLRVVKVAADPGDPHPVGACGVILGSYFDPYITSRRNTDIRYFVEWEDEPRVAMAVPASKLARFT